MELSPEEIVRWCVLVVESYAVLGLLFGICFVALGVQRVDTQAAGARWGFRLLILPGVAAFWPLLLRRWLSGANDPPLERNPHR